MAKILAKKRDASSASKFLWTAGSKSEKTDADHLSWKIRFLSKRGSHVREKSGSEQTKKALMRGCWKPIWGLTDASIQTVSPPPQIHPLLRRVRGSKLVLLSRKLGGRLSLCLSSEIPSETSFPPHPSLTATCGRTGPSMTPLPTALVNFPPASRSQKN